MKTKTQSNDAKVVFVAVVMGVLLAAPGQVARSAAPVEIAVVVNADNPLPSMSADDVRNFYMKRKSSWPNGEKIRPVDTETDDAARAVFVTQVLKTTSTELERYWLEIKYRAAESPPKRMSDDEGVIKYVSAFKGAIGFVPAAAAEKAKDRSIRVVLRIKQ
jgi:ABC-type phosphate transport system substrate-binding protein